MTTFIINGTTYNAKPFGFNMVCLFEDMGLAMSDMASKTTSFMRAYFAISAGITKEEAGELMEKHIVEGGTFDSLADAMAKEVEKSDFFRSLTKATEKKVAKKKDEV